VEPKARSISVGRRLTFLVASEIATALVLLVLGYLALQSLARGSQFMHRFVLVPIQDISAALDDVARLGRNPADPELDENILHQLHAFVVHYRSEIQVAGNSGRDARRQRTELRKAGRLILIDEEQQVVGSLERRLERLLEADGGAGIQAADVDGLRTELRELMRMNLEFVDAAQDDITMHAARTSGLLVSIGLVGIGLAAALGWRVRGAIAPRISSLVRKVRAFSEYGVLERVRVAGRDDIAVLGNAIDVGFAAIAERNRERERFLAVAAHELKTPMASIIGFIQAAAANPAQRDRAMEVVRRQTARLARLVEELLWAARVRAGELPFHPVPVDIAQVARRLADEVQEAVPGHPIVVVGSPSIRVLADETLLTHALWSLLCYAGLLSAPNESIQVVLLQDGARVVVTLRVRGASLAPEELIRVFEPFSTLQFEGQGQPRAAMGLFLCREIARVHSGTLRVSDEPGVGPVLTFEVPA
jgi:signal transduction histidine kinase